MVPGTMAETGPEREVIALRWLVPLLFVPLASFPLFMHLDGLPLRIWDESRQAINALEMARSGNYLVTCFDGQPEMWSTKPPLLIWCQAFFFNLIGPGELGLRLPAAIAAFLIGWLLLRVCMRELDAPWLGLIACAILYTNDGFINMHVARSGDYDAPMILWMTASAGAMFRWTREGRPQELLLFFVFLTLGVLTKSVQALLFLPGIGLYLLLRKQVLPLLRSRMFYLGALLFIVLVGAFYMGRESVNPGYLKAVWENELGGRYASVLSGHDHPWHYYTDQLIDHHFTPWWWLVPSGIVIGLLARSEPLRQWSIYLSLIGACYLYVISTADTKLTWYEAPLIPLLAFFAAVPIHLVFVRLHAETWSVEHLRGRVLPYLFLFTCFVWPYSTTIGRVYFPKEYAWDEDFYKISHYLQKAAKGIGPLEADVLCYDGYNAHLMFYVRLLNEQGQQIQSITKNELLPGMRALASEDHVKWTIEQKYAHEVIRDDGRVKVYRILEFLENSE